MTDNELLPEAEEPAIPADETPADEPTPESAAPVESAAESASDSGGFAPETSAASDGGGFDVELIADDGAGFDAVPVADDGGGFDSMPADEIQTYEYVSGYSYAESDTTSGGDGDWNVGDIDAALAAVATLSEIMPQREAEAEARADARRVPPAFEPEMKLPPMTTLRRGSLGSIIPALFRIGLGAWLTLTTTSGAPPDPLLVAAVVVGGIVVSLLAQWLGTGRWSRGALFFALLVLLVAGVIAFSLQPTGIDLARGYPLLAVALGLAIVISGLLARPFNLRLLAPGALIVLAGLVGLLVTLDFVPGDLLTAAAPVAPVVLAIVLLLWLLPLVFRRR